MYFLRKICKLTNKGNYFSLELHSIKIIHASHLKGFKELRFSIKKVKFLSSCILFHRIKHKFSHWF